MSDEEMVETVAGQTDSASENADVAGKDWDGDPARRRHRPTGWLSAGPDSPGPPAGCVRADGHRPGSAGDVSIPAPTVALVASSTRMNRPVTRLRA